MDNIKRKSNSWETW